MSALEGRRLELWSRLSSRVAALQELLAGLDAEQWKRRCEGEGWSIGLIGCHVALGLRRQAKWAEMALAGRPPQIFSWERTNGLNALVARRIVSVEQPDVLQSLADGLERWGQLLERATDADLARTALRFGDKDTSVEWVAGAMAPRHIDDHVRSIHAALGAIR